MVSNSSIINLDISINNQSNKLSNQINNLSPSLNLSPTDIPTTDIPITITNTVTPMISTISNKSNAVLRLKGLYMRHFRYWRR